VDGTALPRGVVVVGASAGGVEALSHLVARLPDDLAATVLVTVHVPASSTSVLPAILNRRGPLPARHAEDGELLRAGEILVAPPDRHLVVLEDRVALSRGPQENGHRPSVDVLFRSAARAWGPRVMSVVLSGTLDDGAAGVVAVSRHGGRCLVQEDALFDGMPRAATRADHPESVAVREIADRVVAWLRDVPEDTTVPASAGPTSATSLSDEETLIAQLDPDTMHRHDRPGEAAGLGCPDCAGALFRIEEGGLVRFRCRVGHAWSSESLLVRQTVALESALWTALRSLEEKAALNDELRTRAAASGHDLAAARFAAGADEATRAAELLRGLVADVGGSATAAEWPDGLERALEQRTMD
jgi:two-component system chemotaxis response regulator CheB